MEKSGCEFYRNGSWHTATDASAHLCASSPRSKGGTPQKSADEFIEVVATRSSISGEPVPRALPGRCADRQCGLVSANSGALAANRGANALAGGAHTVTGRHFGR